MEVGLLALLIEVVSVTAAGMQMKKPIVGLAKQFQNKGTGPKAPATPEEKDQAFKKGISVLASTSKAVTRA